MVSNRLQNSFVTIGEPVVIMYFLYRDARFRVEAQHILCAYRPENFERCIGYDVTYKPLSFSPTISWNQFREIRSKFSGRDNLGAREVSQTIIMLWER